MDIDGLDNDRASQRIVRRYRFDVDDRITEENVAYPLTQVLVTDRGEARDIDPWRRFFENRKGGDTESDPVTDILLVESRNLKDKWVIFYEGCSKDEKLDLGSSEPTIEGVLEVVNRIQRDWQSQREDNRRGKAIRMFRGFCRGIHSHRSFLKILPDGNEYVSIFAGTLNVILKACANHERILEGLSEAFSTITDHVAQCQVELEMFDTPEMKEAVARLYADIFLFLSDLMDYLSKKRLRRLLDSFNEDLCKKYEDQLSNISKKAEIIKRFAEQGSRAETRAVRLTLEDLNENMARNMIVGQEGVARLRAEIMARDNRMEAERLQALNQRDAVTQRQLFEQLFVDMNRGLLDEAHQAVVDLRAAIQAVHQGTSLPFSYHTGLIALSSSEAGVPANLKIMRDDVLLHSKHFEDFFDRTRVRLLGARLRPVMQTEQVVRRLSNWIKGDPGLLWLEGPASPLRDEHNPLATIAARVVDLADQGNVPVISYFCHLPRGEKLRPGNETRQMQAFAALIASLTRQAMELLLPQFETTLDLSDARLRLINGTKETLPETMLLLEDVLKILDMQLLCVIDGLHWLDDPSTVTILTDLVKALRNGSVKVLLTTTGRSVVLQREVSRMDKLTIESLNPGGADVRLSGQTLPLKDKAT